MSWVQSLRDWAHSPDEVASGSLGTGEASTGATLAVQVCRARSGEWETPDLSKGFFRRMYETWRR